MFACCAAFPFLAEASISFSVTSFHGGKYINFGEVNSRSSVTQEIKVKITNSGTTPYQIKHVLIDPIVSEKGVPLKEQVLFYYTVIGSNSQGSLYDTVLKPLGSREDILYASDSRGSSDTFKIIYLFNGSKLTSPGHYIGRLGFVLEPREGNPQTIVFTVEFNASLEFDAKVSLFGRKITLTTDSKEASSQTFTLSLKAAEGKNVRIYQKVEEFPVNEKGGYFPEGYLKFFISQSLKGKGEYRTPTILEKKELLIYASNEGSDELKITFLLDGGTLEKITAGTYRGKIIYRVEEEGLQKTIPVDFDIEVKKVFDIKVISEGLEFYDLRPQTLPQDREVVITVASNLERPYQISQRLTGPLTDQRGNTIAFKYFLMREELVEGEGEVVHPQFTPMSEKEEVVFISDAKGEPTTFRVIYRLIPSIEILAGRYSTAVTYSLSER